MEYHLDLTVLTAGDVAGLLTYPEVVNAVEETFRRSGKGLLFHPVKEPIWLDDAHTNMIKAMSAYLKDTGVAGIKWVSMMTHQKPGLPTCGGNLLILTDGSTGQPYALMEASAITAMRTGGGHGVVAAKYLAKSGAATLAIVGCGEEGRAAAQSFLEQFSQLTALRLCDRDPQAMAELARLHADRADVVCCATPAQAAQGADILVMATTSRTPLIHYEDLSPGCLVVGLYTFFDLDGACAAQADKWILGSWSQDTLQVLENPGLKHYGLRKEDVAADLGEVILGKKPGRESEREIIVYTHFGMGALDVAVGDLAYRKARDAGIGHTLRLL